MQETQRRKKRPQGAKKAYPWLLAAAAALVIGLTGAAYLAERSPVASNALGLLNLQPDWSLLVTTEDGLRSYASSRTQIASRMGVDVSVHQGEIDWQQVKDAGIDFAMIRVGFRGYRTGALAEDSRFAQNVAGAAAAGLSVGVYFYSQALTEAEAEAEADFVLSRIGGTDVTYPVVYDLEEYAEAPARTDGLSGAQATANALAFCKKVEAAGYLPMVYMNGDWDARMYDASVLSSRLVWYADYTEEPTRSGGFAMWQYTNQGSIPGISSAYVDLDLMFYDTRASENS